MREEVHIEIEKDHIGNFPYNKGQDFVTLVHKNRIYNFMTDRAQQVGYAVKQMQNYR